VNSFLIKRKRQVNKGLLVLRHSTRPDRPEQEVIDDPTAPEQVNLP